MQRFCAEKKSKSHRNRHVFWDSKMNLTNLHIYQTHPKPTNIPQPTAVNKTFLESSHKTRQNQRTNEVMTKLHTLKCLKCPVLSGGKFFGCQLFGSWTLNVFENWFHRRLIDFFGKYRCRISRLSVGNLEFASFKIEPLAEAFSKKPTICYSRIICQKYFTRKILKLNWRW